MSKYFLILWTSVCFLSISLAQEETPVVHDNMLEGNTQLGSRPWRAPDYSNQEKALGWTQSSFAVLPGMETQVSFWLDIYTKYTTHQGVFHDSEYINFVYKEVDFNDIQSNPDLTSIQKENARQKRVAEHREEIEARLTRLSKLESAEGLTGEDLRVWEMFSAVDEPDKFLKASKKGRLRFQLGQRDRFILGIYFSGRYLEDFEEVFRQEGLPIELTRLVFVESSFNIYAQSRVGASGLWQIMPFVGRNQVMMNPAVDDRNHPWHATELAAKILKQNYRMLEDWPLAITGYNHGAYGIRKLTRRYETNNLAELLANAQTRGSFGFASRNFHASFLAALEAERNAKKYFGDVLWSEPLPKTKFTLETPVKYSEILEWFEGDEVMARMFNPHITFDARRGRTHIPPKATIFVQTAQSKVAGDALERFKKENRKILGPRSYKVAKGDTISEIADRFGVSAQLIVRINGLKSAHHIRVGQTISIPYPEM